MSDANTSYDVNRLITMMGGVRLPLFCRYVPRNMPPSLFVFLIPGNSDHISYEARAKCPNHARKFLDPSVVAKALGGRSYVDNNPYNVRSVVDLDEVLKEIGKFGHIIPGADEENPKESGTYYTIGNTRTNGLASNIASPMVLDMYYSFKIHNIRMLIPNTPVTLMREHIRQLFYVKTFIPFTREALACAIDDFECSKCRFAGLCDMGQIPIGILSSATIHLGNPLYVRKGDLSLVRYKRVSEITGTTVYGRRGPLSDQVSSIEAVGASRFDDSSMLPLSPRESEFFQSKTEPCEDPEFVWAKFDEVQIDYRHYFRINVDTDRDVIDTSLEDMVVSENSFDARLVLASRGVFDELPALKKVFGL